MELPKASPEVRKQMLDHGKQAAGGTIMGIVWLVVVLGLVLQVLAVGLIILFTIIGAIMELL